MERPRQSFNEVLNQAILKGLADDRITPEEEPFVVASRPIGLRPGHDGGRLNFLANDLDADPFLSLTRDRLNRAEEK